MVDYSTGGGGKTLFLFKDERGYASPSGFKDHYWSKSILGKDGEIHLLGRSYYADKYVITLMTNAPYLGSAPEVYDNVGSTFQYNEYIVDSPGYGKISTYFLVLDEIPEDYKVYVNGVPYAINELTNRSLITALGFGIIFAVPLVIVIVLTMRKAKKKRHKQKMDAIWRAK